MHHHRENGDTSNLHERSADAASTANTGLVATLWVFLCARGSGAPPARRRVLATLAAVTATFGGLAFTASPTLAFETHLFETSFGPDGTSATRFERPSSVAVDQSTGSIYVGDMRSNTVQRFDLANAPEPFLGIAANVVEGKLTGFGELRPIPDQVAVNSATHDVYFGVGESLAAFQPDGEPADFTAGPGIGTNEIMGSEVCGVAVDSSGDIYVSERLTGVRVFAPSGTPLASFAASPVCDLAVDSNGTVYVNGADEPAFMEDFGPVQKFTPSVFPVTLSTTYESGGVVDGAQSLGVAVDPSNNHLFVDEGDQIAEFDATGKELGSFGNSGPGTLPINIGRQGVGVAVNGATGQVYVAQGLVAQGEEGLVEVFGPAIQLPDVSTATASAIEPTGAATLNGTVEPEGIVLSECEFEYVVAAHYEVGASDPYAAGATAPCAPTAEAIPAGGETPVHADVTGLEPGVTYHYRLRASNKTALNDNPPNFGGDETFNTPPRPTISGENVSNLIKASVDLNAQVDPGGLEVENCDFEYGTGTSYGKEAACVPATIPAGTEPVAVSAHVEGLEANREYHWRVLAANKAGSSRGVDQTFVYDTSGEGLPDNRAYEMVSPPQKNAALLNAAATGLYPAIAEDGSRLILTSIQCFANAESCTGAAGNVVGSQYLFTRAGTGWLTSALAPPATQFEENSGVAVSAETGMELFGIPTPPDMEPDFYIRETDGSFVDVGPVTPPSSGPEQNPWEPVGALAATSNFSRIAFSETQPFWPVAAGAPRSVYEYTGTGNAAPLLVGVSGGPDSDSLISKCGTGMGDGRTDGNPGDMSADGETLYFTVAACAEGTGENAGPGHNVPVAEVFARLGGARTVPISEPSAFSQAAPYPGCVEEPCIEDVNDQANWSGASFAGASNDGSKAFFTSNQRLTDGAGSEGNLYEYDSNNAPAEGNLVDVSAGEVSGQEPRVQGVVAISADGSHVYFVAQGVLTGIANTQGEVAQEGADNLYVFARAPGEPRGEIHFIAQLPGTTGHEAENLWTSNDDSQRANVTPNGRFLVFESYGALTPDTHADGAAQIFRYDAQTGELMRVSVGERGFNNDGNTGVGDARLAWPYEAKHAGPARSDPTMSNDGRFVFFESPVGLTPHALNDVQIAAIDHPFEGFIERIYAENVYEWREGQVFLISDGKDTAADVGGRGLSAVKLLGSDGTGANVFFSTADQLVPKDTDTQLDYYDARICEPENGNPCAAEPSLPLPPCDGESCHGAPAATPSLLAPGSASFDGAGNAPPTPPASASAKPLTRAQKLAAALRACRRDKKKAKRVNCEKQAKRKYGAARKAGSAKRASDDRRAE